MRQVSLAVFIAVVVSGSLFMSFDRTVKASEEPCQTVAPLSGDLGTLPCGTTQSRFGKVIRFAQTKSRKLRPKSIECVAGGDGRPCACDKYGQNCQGVCVGIACLDKR
jgi:hypothetical protein